MWRLEKSDCHMGRTEDIMFGFRIIEMADGNQIIDRNLKTPYNALTPFEMVEYTEVDIQLAVMDGLKRKARSEAERGGNF